MMRLFIGLCLALAASGMAGVAQDGGPADEIIGGPLAGPMPFVSYASTFFAGTADIETAQRLIIVEQPRGPGAMAFAAPTP